MRNLNFSVFLGRVILLGFLSFSVFLNAQNTLTNVAGEYGIIGALSGDQMMSHVAFDANGGWVVYQDNAIDGDGQGIAARHLNGTLSGDLGLFRVNQIGAGEQENPQVSLLKTGGTAFVWQGGKLGFQDIFARFMKNDGTFVSNDVQINSYTNRDQIEPALACLVDGSVIVTWSSWAEDGDGYGVYGRLLSTNGTPLNGEFRLSQTTAFNQRSSAVAALPDGNFVAVWVSQALFSTNQQMTFGDDTNEYSVVVSNSATAKIYARIFDSVGSPVGGEFLVSGSAGLCNTPSVAASGNGGFIITWGQCSSVVSNSWDVFAKVFSETGTQVGSSFLINTYTYGDQFGPKVAAIGTNALITWVSLGQDSSFEGIYGQYVGFSGVKLGSEISVSTTAVGRQMQPALAVDGNGRFLVVWSSYIGAATSFDLFAQRLISNGSLPTPSAPYVSALSSDSLSVTWPDVAGYSVAFYELSIDGAPGVAVNGLRYTITNLAAASSHSVRLLYQLADGRRSPNSSAATGVTWGADLNGDGLPDDWQTVYWGPSSNWPGSSADSDGDGASNLSEFLAGTNPKDASSVLKTSVARSGLQMSFSWNTEPGFIYQVQVSNDLLAWQDYGGPRFAHGNSDGILLGVAGQSSFYRVIRLR